MVPPTRGVIPLIPEIQGSRGPVRASLVEPRVNRRRDTLSGTLRLVGTGRGGVLGRIQGAILEDIRTGKQRVYHVGDRVGDRGEILRWIRGDTVGIGEGILAIH